MPFRRRTRTLTMQIYRWRIRIDALFGDSVRGVREYFESFFVYYAIIYECGMALSFCCLHRKKGNEAAENHEIFSTETRLGYYNDTIISTLKWYQMGYLLFSLTQRRTWNTSTNPHACSRLLELILCIHCVPFRAWFILK